MTIQKAEMPPGRKRTKTAAPSPSRMDRDEDQGEVAWKNNKGNPPGKRGGGGVWTGDTNDTTVWVVAGECWFWF